MRRVYNLDDDATLLEAVDELVEAREYLLLLHTSLEARNWLPPPSLKERVSGHLTRQAPAWVDYRLILRTASSWPPTFPARGAVSACAALMASASLLAV